MALLEVRDLRLSIGTVSILRGVSLSVSEGEIVGLVGRNGAGKTSTLKSILGLYRPKAGSVKFKGTDVTRLPPEKRVLMGMGYSPEDSRVFPDLTVEENLRLPLWVRGERGEDDALRKVFEVFPEIRRLIGRKGRHLSGGERKMVSIGRALALDPALLLLDEPFEGLAPMVVERFKTSIERIRDMGKAILIAESRVDHLVGLADRVYVIERGEIVFSGKPSELMSNEALLRMIGRY